MELTGRKYNLSDTDDITTNSNNIVNNITYSNIDINNVSSSITSPSPTTVFNSKFFVSDIG